MPFVIRPREAHFTWDADSPIAGLEVTMSLRIGLADMVRMGRAWQDNDPDEIAEAAAAVGRYLVAWNLEEPDPGGGSTPVPATPEGWAGIDIMIQVLVFQRWMDEINAKAGAYVDPKAASASRNGKSSAGRAVTTVAP
jgi:hypothetical protein